MLQKCFKNASKILLKLLKNPDKMSNKISAELAGARSIDVRFHLKSRVGGGVLSHGVAGGPAASGWS